MPQLTSRHLRYLAPLGIILLLAGCSTQQAPVPHVTHPVTVPQQTATPTARASATTSPSGSTGSPTTGASTPVSAAPVNTPTSQPSQPTTGQASKPPVVTANGPLGMVDYRSGQPKPKSVSFKIPKNGYQLQYVCTGAAGVSAANTEFGYQLTANGKTSTKNVTCPADRVGVITMSASHVKAVAGSRATFVLYGDMNGVEQLTLSISPIVNSNR